MSSKPIKITLKTLTGGSHELALDANSTVLDVKQTIHKTQGIPPDQQRIIYSGKIMHEASQTMEDAGVADGSTVHLVLRLRGEESD